MKFKFFIFCLKQIDPIIFALIIILSLIIFFNFGRIEGKNSISNISNGKFIISFEVQEYLNDNTIAKEIILEERKFLGKVLLKGKSFDIGDTIKCEGIFKKSNNIRYLEYLENKGVLNEFSCIKLISKTSNYLHPQRLGYHIKIVLKEKISKILNFEQRQIFEGVVLGDKTLFSKELDNYFIKTGTSHIASLSGFNITIIFSFVYFCLSFIKKKSIKTFVCVICVVLFILLVGLSESILRAFVQNVYLIIGLLFFKKVSIVRVLSLMVITLIFINPLIIFSISFQLSFLCASGLILFSNQVLKFISGELNLLEIGKQTLISMVMVLPITINTFQYISLIGILVNILIIPVVEIVTVLGLISILFLIFFEPISFILINFVGILCQYIYNVVSYFSIFPYAGINTNFEVPLLIVVLYYMTLILFLVRIWVRKLLYIFANNESKAKMPSRVRIRHSN